MIDVGAGYARVQHVRERLNSIGYKRGSSPIGRYPVSCGHSCWIISRPVGVGGGTVAVPVLYEAFG